ncbi:MAG: hypothetical protein H7232_03975 [Aeromicrobium sp.]|nr:hypothetical protein [Burkholderiales bacterium]
MNGGQVSNPHHDPRFTCAKTVDDLTSLSAGGSLRRPNTQGTVFRNKFEIIVGAEECEVMANAELREECINSSNLNPGAAASVSKYGTCDMILAVRLD